MPAPVILKPIEKRTRLHTLVLRNFMSYEDFRLEIGDNPIHGLFGPNGCGKSSLLRAVQLLFSKFGGFDEPRLKSSLSKYDRNGSGRNFEIEGHFTADGEDYIVVIGSGVEHWRWGEIPGLEGPVIKGAVREHPVPVRRTLTEQVWFATYDHQLGQFQIEKSRWDRFKLLFEAVTGYRVEPIDHTNVFVDSPDLTDREREHHRTMENYVFGMKIMKPGGVIREHQCSDGERKVIKHFTHLFNKPDDGIPSIVLIDNIEMHIARDRQLPLLAALEGCFPETQIIFTTHGDSIICHYDASRLTNLYYKDLDQNVDPWRKEAMRIVAVAETLMPGDEALDGLMDKLRSLDRHAAARLVEKLFARCGTEFAERIGS